MEEHRPQKGSGWSVGGRWTGALTNQETMLSRNRFVLVLLAGGVLAVLSFRFQFLQPAPSGPGPGDASLGKSRKRVSPVIHTEPPEPDPIRDSYRYCNLPNQTEHTREGHSPADYKLLFVQVMIRHGDRYPLYPIPQTKKPPLDCTLSPHRKPSHPLLAPFISHMAQGGHGHWDSPLGSLPRVPNHSSCELGELTQTGVVQHLKNGELLRRAYLTHRGLLPPDWSARHLWVETTAKSRTLQSGLAFLYGLLPDFDWPKVSVRQQRSSLYCGGRCECPARNRYLEEDRRRQYRLRLSDAELERTYVAMAKAVGVAPRAMRAANPVDSLLCHFCHALPFPCAGPRPLSAPDEGACLTPRHLAAIRRQQWDDERDRLGAGLYRRYAVLAAHPFLNRTALRMERVVRGDREPVLALASAHDVTVAPVLSALGLEGAGFPRFAARLVLELWEGSSPGDQGVAGAYVRVLYDGRDLTFDTAFCRGHRRDSARPLCPLGNFLSFVRRDMFGVVNATSYQQACRQ